MEITINFKADDFKESGFEDIILREVIDRVSSRVEDRIFSQATGELSYLEDILRGKISSFIESGFKDIDEEDIKLEDLLKKRFEKYMRSIEDGQVNYKLFLDDFANSLISQVDKNISRELYKLLKEDLVGRHVSIAKEIIKEVGNESW